MLMIDRNENFTIIVEQNNVNDVKYEQRAPDEFFFLFWIEAQYDTHTH